MPHAKRLIVGLGNPGAEYEGTRHNVGFRVVEALAEARGIALKHEKEALVGWGRHRGFPFGLAKPLTYVNRSGQAVKKLAQGYDLAPQELLIVYDDLHLAPGDVRLRASGGGGGHNGMQDILDRLGTQEIPRLRLGIGGDFPRGQMADFVLSPFSKSEAPLLEGAVAQAAQAALAFVSDGVTTAMDRFN